MLKWLAIGLLSIVGHLGTLPVPALHMSPLQRFHSHTHWMDWYSLYKRTCALCSAHWLIKVSSERAREAEEGSREEREHLCDVTPPYFTHNSTSDLYFLKRLNHWSEQASQSQRKVRFFRRRGKKLAALCCFFWIQYCLVVTELWCCCVLGCSTHFLRYFFPIDALNGFATTAEAGWVFIYIRL